MSTIGIYKLVFKNTDKIYIGKSIHIDRRLTEHKYILKNNNGAKKLQEAYILYGVPELEILKECTLEELDYYEDLFINKFDSINNGFNSVPGGKSYSNHKTFDYKSRYSKNQYLEILFYLTNTKLSVKEISDICDIPSSIIYNISALNTHSWLEEADPENYKILIEIHNRGRRSYSNTQNIPVILDIENNQYQVFNLTDFAKEHNLDRSSLWCLLNGRCNTHKGWHLLNTQISTNPDIQNPDGEIFSIPFRGIRKFAREHNLGQSDLTKLLNGKIKSHKGWTLVNNKI